MSRTAGIIVVACCLAAGQARAQSTAARMQRVVSRYAAETGQEVLCLGSWITGRNYGDVLRAAGGHVSDHDMRLLLPRGTDPARARDAWLAARRRMAALIRDEFGDDATRVLGQTNLYAPTQLMQGVEDTADALARFRRAGAVPNLGHTGRVTAGTPARFAEGLYGPGAGAYTQSYEQSAGRLFYARDGRVYRGLSDLTHLSEGVARYTVGGTASTAGQWTAKAAEALAEGDPQALVKYLDRFARDVTKCRSLARLAKDSVLSNELRTLAAQIERDPGLLRSSRGAITGLLQRAQLESSLLRQLEHANPMRRAVARVTLDAIEARSALGLRMSRLAEKVPPDVLVRGVFLALTVAWTSRSLGEGDMPAVYDHAVSGAGLLAGGAEMSAAQFMVTLAPGAMVALTHLILEQARQGGYEWVAGRQAAFDLLDGIFSTTGGIADRRYTLDQLVNFIRTEEGLRSFVLARAHQAADRGFGPANARHDVQTAEAIFARCYPVILAAWHAARARLMEELWDIMDAVEHNAVVLFYEPCPAVPNGGSATVTVRVEPTDPDEGARLRRSRDLLRVLLGADRPAFANVLTRWTPRGAGDPARPVRSYRLPIGEHLITFEESVSIGAVGLPFRSQLQRDVVRKAQVVVRVGAASPPVAPPTPAPAGARWRPPLPTLGPAQLGKGWTLAGRHPAPHLCQWSFDLHRADPRRFVDVRVLAVYSDHPDGVTSDAGWSWDARRRRITGKGKPTAMPYGDERLLLWEIEDTRVADGSRSVAFVVRWGELMIEVVATGHVPWDAVRSAARAVLDECGRQLEARRPKR